MLSTSGRPLKFTRHVGRIIQLLCEYIGHFTFRAIPTEVLQIKLWHVIYTNVSSLYSRCSGSNIAFYLKKICIQTVKVDLNLLWNNSE